MCPEIHRHCLRLLNVYPVFVVSGFRHEIVCPLRYKCIQCTRMKVSELVRHGPEDVAVEIYGYLFVGRVETRRRRHGVGMELSCLLLKHRSLQKLSIRAPSVTVTAGPSDRTECLKYIFVDGVQRCFSCEVLSVYWMLKPVCLFFLLHGVVSCGFAVHCRVSNGVFVPHLYMLFLCRTCISSLVSFLLFFFVCLLHAVSPGRSVGRLQDGGSTDDGKGRQAKHSPGAVYAQGQSSRSWPSTPTTPLPPLFSTAVCACAVVECACCHGHSDEYG